VAALALELVSIRSFTGETREVTERFIAECQDLGLEIERFEDYPSTPAVVARWRGTGNGPCLEFNGHLDTVPLDHAPPRISDGMLSGRGATDMKGGVACMFEAVHALQSAGVRLRGDLLVSTHGLHELPAGHGEDLIARVRRGVHGDAALIPEITEVGSSRLAVIGLGAGMFDITISRPGPVWHETSTPPGTPHPLLAAALLVRRLEERNRQLAEHPLPHVGPESIFVGELHSGDFYNRLPTQARVVGMRRWGPQNTFEAVDADLRALCKGVEEETGTTLQVDFRKTRDGFLCAEDAPLVLAVQRAYTQVTGRELPPAGMRTVGDASVFYSEGCVPALYHGPHGTGHHGDHEEVPLAELQRASQVLALAALYFCGLASADNQ
jgi:acetylornithine deacetylase/succinyl-diaminopimelate desuccinylase-like protein